MSHRNAPLSELGRLRLARCVVDDGWPLLRAAERFQVSVTTTVRWASRYRVLGEAGMADHSSRPHHSPRRTRTRTERRIIKVRVVRRWGPARIGYLLGLHPSTVYRVLTHYGLAKLRWPVRKVLTDNGSCYLSHTFTDALGDIEHRRTRPYRPQTNGKVERFHRTLADEWAYPRLYRSDNERCDEFSAWLHTYNHRGHTALGGQPPATRVPNLSGQYT
jgi:transposase InsO family protein